jgi:hypothetical protein
MGISPDDGAASVAYDYVAEFNELMALPSPGRLEQFQSSSCTTACNALISLVDGQIQHDTHYEKPIWIIGAFAAKPVGQDGRREISITLDPIKEPVMSASGQRITLGDEWRRVIDLGLAPVPGSDGKWEIDKVAISKQ